MPRLSVLLPCRNAAAWLPLALRSLTRQTYTDFEIIGVDDGSRDATGRILQRAAAADARLRVLDPGRVGLVRALQLAAHAAAGEILARMDADDIAHSRRFALQLALLDSGIAACGARVRCFPRRILKAGGRAYEAWLNACVTPDDIERELFIECPIAHPTLMIRRAAFEAVGGYRAIDAPEDYDLVMRLWRAGHRMANVPHVLLAWRDRPDRTSRTHPRYSREAFRRLKVTHLLETRAAGRPLLIAGAGPTGKLFAREALRQGATLAAFADLDPRKIGQTVHGAPVIHPREMTRFRAAFGVGAVAKAEARADLREHFRSAGFAEMRDFLLVA